MRVVWVVDIDTSIADNTQREHLLVKSCMVCGGGVPAQLNALCPACGSDSTTIPQDSWDAFMNPSAMANDVPDHHAQKVLRKAQFLGIEVHYLTGRRDNTRTCTQDWLTQYFNFDPNKNLLLMRTESGPASEYKEMKFKELMERQGYTDRDLFCFFEDDEHVIPMYAKYGIVHEAPACWQHMWSTKPNTAEPFIKR